MPNIKTLQQKLDTSMFSKNYIDSYDFVEHAALRGDDFLFELELTLLNCDKNIRIHHFSSDLNIQMLFDILPVSKISLIEITLMPQDNGNVSFFNAEIHLPYGSITLATNWCLWQDMRMHEFVYGLLKPIYTNKLEDVTMMDSKMPFFLKSDYLIEYFKEKALGQFPNQMHPQFASTAQEIAKYAADLDKARNIE